MNLKNVLQKLSDLEESLQNYSYENLTASEAQELKNSFAIFRQHLETIQEKKTSEVSHNEPEVIANTIEESETDGIENSLSQENFEHTGGSLRGSSRFTAYLKDSPLSKEQLDYINEILESADIHTRVKNDYHGSAYYESQQHYQKIRSKNSSKTKSMSTGQKPNSDALKPSQSSSGKLMQLDLEPILEDCLGKKDLLEELIKLYKQNALEFIGQIKLHIQNLDFEGIRFASHKIKSGLRMMNTQELLVIAEQIEVASKTDQDIKHMKFLFDCFVKEYPCVEKAIDTAFEKLD